MVDAGIECPDEVIQTFKKLQRGNEYHCITFKIVNKKKVAVDWLMNNDDDTDWDWDVICDELTKSGEPRFAACDFHFLNSENLDTTKLLFVAWCPETARPGDKMLYASTKEGFKAKLDGVQKVLQATDDGQLDHSEICRQVFGVSN